MAYTICCVSVFMNTEKVARFFTCSYLGDGKFIPENATLIN